MTAINIATQIPNSIVTLEQLVVWGIVTLGRVNPTTAVLETDTRAELAVQTGVFSAADETTRFMGRVSIELDPAFMSNRDKKFWMFAEEFGDVQVPAAYTSN